MNAEYEAGSADGFADGAELVARAFLKALASAVNGADAMYISKLALFDIEKAFDAQRATAQEDANVPVTLDIAPLAETGTGEPA